MRLKIKVSKLANKFFFISNLSEWHFSCRPAYNREWLKMSGTFTGEEKEALKDFGEVLKKYGFTYKKGVPQYVGRFFYLYPGKQAWEKLRGFLNKKDFTIIRQVFRIFEPRLEKIWTKSIHHYEKRVFILRQSLEDKKFKSLLKDLESIFLSRSREKHLIEIIVLFSPLRDDATAAGGANVGSSAITFEIPKLKPRTWRLSYSLAVLGHEIAHLLWGEEKFKKLMSNTLKRKKIPVNIKGVPMGSLSLLNEIIIGSFLPSGYLGQKYFSSHLSFSLLDNIGKGFIAAKMLKKGTGKYHHRDLIRYLVWQLYPLAVIYGRQRKKIDKYYIGIAAKTLKDLIKKRGGQRISVRQD